MKSFESFEISLRNAIDKHYTVIHGADWLRDSSQPGGMFDIPQCRVTRGVIINLLTNFGAHYSHSKLLAKMDFGFWRYLFAQPQYRAEPSVSPSERKLRQTDLPKICRREMKNLSEKEKEILKEHSRRP